MYSRQAQIDMEEALIALVEFVQTNPYDKLQTLKSANLNSPSIARIKPGLNPFMDNRYSDSKSNNHHSRSKSLIAPKQLNFINTFVKQDNHDKPNELIETTPFNLNLVSNYQTIEYNANKILNTDRKESGSSDVKSISPQVNQASGENIRFTLGQEKANEADNNKNKRSNNILSNLLKSKVLTPTLTKKKESLQDMGYSFNANEK